jgi:hypothetical protein
MRKIKDYADFLNESVPYSNEFIKGLAKSFVETLKNSQKAEESPRGSNKGKEIEAMQKASGTTPGNPWCAAFIYDVFSKSKIGTSEGNKIPMTPSVKIHWQKSKGKKITAEEVSKDPKLIKPGMAFFYLTRNEKGEYPGPGHTGIVLSVNPSERSFTSMEGNTNPLDGAREGYGSFLVTRKIDDPSISTKKSDRPAKLLGFIDYFSPFRNTFFDSYLKEEIEKAITNVFKNKTEKEKSFLSNNPWVMKDYEKNYKKRFK